VTKIEKQLDQARIDLDAVNHELMALEAAKAEASKTSATFAKWRASVDEKTGERERLEICVVTLEAEVEQHKQEAARADLLSRRAALEKQTNALARKITEEGSKAAALLVQLAEEASANAQAVEQLNRELSNDEQLFHADHLARHRDPAPRENLEESIVDLWTFESSGELVGDPDLVRALSYERGVIPAIGASLRNTPVIRKRFKQVRYLERGDREYAEPLADVLRLPRFDGPGILFDHGHALEATPRRELVELIPDSSAAAKPVTEAA
jgi:hypothetical protein